MSPTPLSTLRAVTLLALLPGAANAEGALEAGACEAYCAAMEAICPDVFLGNLETCLATCALYPPGAATAPIRCGVFGQREAIPPAGRPLDLPPVVPKGPIIVTPDLTKAVDDDPRLQSDHSVVPPGFGAVFLPAAGLTRLKDRAPLAALYRGRTVVAEGPLERRLVVEPGEYQVRLGSGAYEQQMVIAVRVVAGRTTIVPPTWAALEVDVVDPQFVPFRGTYELLRSDTREVIGPGFGADELLGERLKIWVVAPGLYKLIQSGGTYRDRTNFATVRLLPGEFTRFSLVQDPDTSQFLGAGEVDAHDAEEEDRRWTFRGIVGGDLSFNRSTVTGSQDGWSLVGDLFLDVAAQLNVDPHVWITRLEVEESQSRRRDTDHFQNISDRLFLHTIYTYHLLPWFGPYVRVALESKLLPRDQEFEAPRDVEILNDAGAVEETLTDVDRVRFAGSFSPIELKQGAGGNFQVLRSRDAELDLRLGLGSRQLVAQGFLQYERRDAGPDRLVPLESNHSEGIEGTALGLARVTRWVTLSSEFDGLEPFNEGQSLLFTWRNQASLRLASFASLNYRFILVRNPVLNVGDPLQTEHDLQLRFSYTLF